ncbi:Transcriptional regulator, PadR family [Stigmatella aurantiaca DW4/3-1]|uniref:Transcriptional regulator, PadR family n=3 Tax=Stigmatella aurantiaca TaxID=41 RepID=E3FWK2_STIAD|nr:Transcriptional regulator, PadR family [Stigmatella aurantiaca DW4/3-1]
MRASWCVLYAIGTPRFSVVSSWRVTRSGALTVRASDARALSSANVRGSGQRKPMRSPAWEVEACGALAKTGGTASQGVAMHSWSSCSRPTRHTRRSSARCSRRRRSSSGRQDPAERLHVDRLAMQWIVTQAYASGAGLEEFGPLLLRCQRLGYADMSHRINVACLYVQSLPRFPEKARQAFAMLDGVEQTDSHVSGKSYGLKIIERVNERTKGAIQLNEGSVYPALKALEREGLLRSFDGEPMPERGGRPRRYYEITGEGLRVANEQRAAVIGLWEPAWVGA